MGKKLIALLLLAMLLLTGCHSNSGQAESVDTTESQSAYDWIAGESPVANQRMGLKRAGVNNADYAIAPNGMYFMYDTGRVTEDGEKISFVLYSDHGSDTVIKLCGRADCDHSNSDCNAYLAGGNNIYYHEGYLYAVSGRGDTGCSLIRMDVDGSNHVTVFDLNQFAQDLGYDFAKCDMIDSGVCLFTVGEWIEVEAEPNEEAFRSSLVESYRYALDGSMEEPQPDEIEGAQLYHCSDVFLTLRNGTQSGGYNGYDMSLWHWDMETDTVTYLTDHPGIAGFYGKEAGYYFRDGAVIRLNYETRQEERLIETGLDGNYYVMCFPDCLVVADQSFEAKDNNLYIYNWDYELVDTVALTYLNGSFFTDQALMAETAERFILTDSISWVPKYYIEKSELGTGKAKVHTFKLPDLTAEFEYWEDQEWLENG